MPCRRALGTAAGTNRSVALESHWPEIRERAGVTDSSARDVLSTMLRDVLASPYTMVGAMLDLGQLGHDYSWSRIKTQIVWALVASIGH
jgi:hypothetical protein